MAWFSSKQSFKRFHNILLDSASLYIFFTSETQISQEKHSCKPFAFALLLSSSCIEPFISHPLSSFSIYLSSSS